MPSSSQALSLRANFQWTFVGNVVYTICQAGVVLVLGRWGGPELLGRWTLAFAIVTPILILAALHLHQVQVTDARNEYAFQHYLGTRIFTTLLALIAVVGCVWLGPYESQTAWVILWVGVAKCADAISEILRALFQRYERMNLSAISMIVKGPAELTALTATYFCTGNLIYCAAAVAGVRILSLGCYDVPVARWLLAQVERLSGVIHRMRPSFDGRVLRRLIWRALPAGVGVVLYELANVIPRYFVEHYHGEAALGYYGAMDYTVAAVMLAVAALGQSSCPRLAHHFAHDPPKYRRLLGRLLGLGAVLGVVFVSGVALVGKTALGLVFRPDYAAYWVEFIFMAVAGAIGFLLFFTGVAVMATRAFQAQLWSCGLACLAALISSWAFVPQYGVLGGVAAILITRAALLVCHLAALAWLITRRGHERAAGASVACAGESQ